MSDLPPPITMTDEAAAIIKAKIADNDQAIGLRLSVGSTGCSGHSYNMDYVLADEDTSGDDRFTHDNGAILFVPKMHSWMLFGTQIGYEQTDLKSGFTFTNPNEAGRCGCGESFTVERAD